MRRWRGLAVLASLVWLAWASQHGHWQVTLLVYGCRLLNVRRLEQVVPLTLLSYFVLGPMPGWPAGQPPGAERILQHRYGLEWLDHPAVVYLALCLRFGLAYAFYRFASRVKSGRIVWLHVLLFTLICVCGAGMPGSVAGDSLLTLVLVWFCAYFYLICYLVLESPNRSPGRFALLYLAPFWELSSVPRPRLDIQPEEDKRERLDRRCIALCLSYGALIACGHWVHASLYGKTFHGMAVPMVGLLPLPELESTGLAPALFEVYPRWQIFLSLVWSSLHRITNYFCPFVFIECCHLALGFDVPRRFSFPWKVSSFADFYNAVMPYYIILINRLYFYPCYSWLRKRRWDRTRAFDVALCFAIVAGGIVTHAVRDVHLVALLGAGEYLCRYVFYTAPYFFLIFLSIRFVRLPAVIGRWLPGPVRFVFFLVIYSLVFLTRQDGLFITWSERWNFVQAFLMGPS